MRSSGVACAVLAFFVALVAGCAQKTGALPRAGMFALAQSHDATSGATHSALALDSDAFAARAAQADYILIGEGHTVVCDHAVQARLLEILAQAGQKPALGLEMVAIDRQDVLDRYFPAQENDAAATEAKPAPLTLAALARDLDWPRSWGYPFEFYAPIFKVALQARLPVYGLNIPAKIMSAYRKNGAEGLTAEQKKFLPAQLIPPPEAQVKALADEFDRHAAMMRAKKNAAPKGDAKQADGKSTMGRGGQEEARERFFRVQSLWDSKMAERAVEARRTSGRPLVILAGAGHVEHCWGIAHRLRILDPSARVLLVAPCRTNAFSEATGGKLPDPELADVFFYCPEEHKSRLGFNVEWRDGAGPTGAAATLVTAVVEGSKADKAGLKVGDVILSAGGKPLAGLADLHMAALKALDQGPGGEKKLGLTVLRAGKRLELGVALGRAEKPTGP